MAVTVSSNIPAVLDPAMAEVFLDGAVRVADVDYFQWMRVRPATTKTIEKTSIDPPGTYGAHVEGNDFTFSAIAEANSKTYTLAESAIAFQLSSLSAHFFDRTALMEFVQNIGAAAARKLNSDGFAVLSDGFADTGPDGASLFSAAHPANVGGNQSNLATVVLNEANLQSGLVTQRRMKTPDNILAGTTPNLLIVPPDEEFNAKELTGSMLSGADMQSNILRSKGLNVLVTPEFSSVDEWYILDSMAFRAYQYIAKGSSPTQYIDADSDNWRVKDRIIHTQGYDGWRGAFGSNP